MKDVAAMLIIMAWIAGIVLAKGFWSTVAAIFFVPWGWYLIVERAKQSWGWA